MKGHLHVLFLGGDDALPHEQAVVLKELAVLLWLLLALVQEEADHPQLENITKLPEGANKGYKQETFLNRDFDYK